MSEQYESNAKNVRRHPPNWKRWKTKAGVDCTFHDLKAKGISDYEGDKQYFSGHTSKSMMEKYNRSADIVDIVDPKGK